MIFLLPGRIRFTAYSPLFVKEAALSGNRQIIAREISRHLSLCSAISRYLQERLRSIRSNGTSGITLQAKVGQAAKAVGRKISSVPGLSKGTIDEALIGAGESLVKHNKEAVSKKLEAFAPLENSYMNAFVENMRRMDLLYHRPDAMITDGENLYIMEAA